MLNADDPRQVQMYNDRSLNLLTRHAIPQQLGRLSEIPKGKFTQTHANCFNKLLADSTKIRQEVVSSMKHMFAGQVSWSPQWDMAGKEKTLWYLVNRRHRIMAREIKERASVTQIRRLMKATNNHRALKLSRKEETAKMNSSQLLYVKEYEEAKV